MGLEEERREAMKEACVGCFSGSLRWARDWAKARFAVDERARVEEDLEGVRSWRRVCWRRVRMHEVQTVEEDIVVCLQCRGYICCMSGADVKEMLLVFSLQIPWMQRWTSPQARMHDLTNARSLRSQSERREADSRNIV